jgi:predicted amidohydrolase YtcJ
MRSSEAWLLRSVVVDGTHTDCRIRAGRVVELGTELRRTDGERLLQGRGGALMPGLADHHIHLRALAAARRSVDLQGAPVEYALDAPGDGPLRVIGSAQALTRAELDTLWPDRPVRVQHRSGALWTLNSAALDGLTEAVSPPERATGQFWRASGRLRAPAPAVDDQSLLDVSAELAGHGVTHVTDATPEGDPALLTVRQHVLSLAPRGTGPLKLVIADHVDPDLTSLVAAIRTAHAADRGVALHSVTAGSLALVIAALREVGPHPQDRVEHAAVCADVAAQCLAELGVVVVTQPSIFARHGEAFRRDTPAADRDLLWRYGGLLRLGVRTVASSDAPYGEADPWASVRAAALRSPDTERVAAATVLDSMLTALLDPAGSPRTIRVGSEADLCVLAHDLPATLSRVISGGSAHVAATFIGGSLVHVARIANSPDTGRDDGRLVCPQLEYQ